MNRRVGGCSDWSQCRGVLHTAVIAHPTFLRTARASDTSDLGARDLPAAKSTLCRLVYSRLERTRRKADMSHPSRTACAQVRGHKSVDHLGQGSMRQTGPPSAPEQLTNTDGTARPG